MLWYFTLHFVFQLFEIFDIIFSNISRSYYYFFYYVIIYFHLGHSFLLIESFFKHMCHKSWPSVVFLSTSFPIFFFVFLSIQIRGSYNNRIFNSWNCLFSVILYTQTFKPEVNNIIVVSIILSTVDYIIYRVFSLQCILCHFGASKQLSIYCKL